MSQEPHAVCGVDRHRLVLREECAQSAAPFLQIRQFGRGLGRSLAQPDQLRVAVRKARSGFAPLVEEDLDVREAFAAGGRDPLFPGNADRGDLVLRDFGQRADVSRGVDDDLLPVEGRIEIRDDADLPARTVGLSIRWPYGEDLGRRAVLPPLTERAAVELFGTLLLDLSSLGARALRSRRRDDDRPSRDRVPPDF
jgi:hypothetical protein